MGLKSLIYKRRMKLLDLAYRKGYNAILVSSPQNIFYLTNYWGEGYLLIDFSKTSLIVPKLEYERAKTEAIGVDIVRAERGSAMLENVKKLAMGYKLCTDNLPTNTFLSLSSLLPNRISLELEIFEKARMIKDDQEISTLVKGGEIMDRLFTCVLEILKPGITERALAAYIVGEMMKLKSDPVIHYQTSFSPVIVASGPNSSLPHATVTDRVIERGDFVIVDIILRYNGYVVDATRTFHVGKADNRKLRHYEAVLNAQLKGVRYAVPGRKAGEVDRIVRKCLEDSGLSDFFIHSTGHGIGLDVHEPPWIRPNENISLERGMAITVEPGIYVPNRYGVRIEDSIIVSDPPLILTRFTKMLTEV